MSDVDRDKSLTYSETDSSERKNQQPQGCWFFLCSKTYDVIKEVDLKIEKSKIYRNLDILENGKKEKEVVVGRFG